MAAEPALHSWHEVWPSRDWDCPAGHTVQCASDVAFAVLALPLFPAAHDVHDDWPVLAWYRPAAHPKQPKPFLKWVN